jgi:phage terminase large subunit-like protein
MTMPEGWETWPAYLRAAFLSQLAWRATARETQMPPRGVWSTWVVMAGRGFGKTLAGSQFLAKSLLFDGYRRAALVVPTDRDYSIVAVGGESGLQSSIPAEALAGGSWETGHNKSLKQITLANGAVIEGFTGANPERLRGPQFDVAWADEIASWDYPQETWDMMQFGLRLHGRTGNEPRVCVTTTPKPLPIIKAFVNDPSVVWSRGSTYDNQANLSPKFIAELKRYEGTELGRQEIHAEVLDFASILRRAWFKPWRKADMPECEFIIQVYDTALTARETSAKSARTTWGIFRNADQEPCAILLECWADKLEYPELRENIEDAYAVFKPDQVIIEAKASGFSLIQELRRKKIPIRGYNPDRLGGKEMRAHLVSDLLKSGRIFVPTKKDPETGLRDTSILAPMSEKLVTACELFPHDETVLDIVDTATMAWSLLRDFRVLTHPGDYTPKPPLQRKVRSAYG